MALSILTARRRFKERLICGLIFKPLRLFCVSCGKYVPSDMPWTCGYCDYDHLKVKMYSFLNKCRRCKKPPKSFKCLHCGGVVFLDKDQDGQHPARSIGKHVSPPTENELRFKKQEHRIEQKDDLRHEIEIADLQAKLARIKDSSEGQNSMAGIKRRLSGHEVHHLGVHLAADEKLAEYKVRFADNPPMLQRGKDLVEDFVDSELRRGAGAS
jgi:hypothetical protein